METAGVKWRIIPARAGFTAQKPREPIRGEDHPRSRGVYPGRRHGPGLESRIIPARAGFTWLISRGGSSPRDHPRSRGVYRPPCLVGADRPGSSPLARGLRLDDEDDDGGVRIIPARAGFTSRSGGTSSARTDHPRSRGVYAQEGGHGRDGQGSSPLARGLRIVGNAASPNKRIIPARAGFTGRSWVPCRGPGDHPRSRGVYLASISTRSPSPGSSPLARGLQRGRHWGGVTEGIIPARAGFTRPIKALGQERLDHPRSRGVYPPST